MRQEKKIRRHLMPLLLLTMLLSVLHECDGSQQDRYHEEKLRSLCISAERGLYRHYLSQIYSIYIRSTGCIRE